MRKTEKPSEKLLKDFEDVRPTYEAFTNKIETLIRELLKDSSIQSHSVTSRVKESDSLRDKLQSGEGKYKELDDITDLSGVRVTCWLLEQVPLIEQIIKENFEIDSDLSVDKRDIMDADRFGYVSVHYIISLRDDRKKLNEFRRYSDLRCEIQIRTILQHAWAEIEHDLGYKSKIEIPKSIKRRFYRLAGLLELADDEFQGLRIDTQDYQNKVMQQIERKDQNIFIDRISLGSYVENSQITKTIDAAILSFFGPAAELESGSNALESDLRILAFFGIKTIEELDNILNKHSEDIIALAEKWIHGDNAAGEVPKGISIFYLGYYLLSKIKERSKIDAYLSMFDFGNDVATKLVELTKEN